MSVCRSCGAQVRWVPTGKTKPDGKPVLQILDAEPTKGVVLEPTSYAGAGPALEPSGTQVARVVDVYTDHHATCPRAADWRRT